MDDNRLNSVKMKHKVDNANELHQRLINLRTKLKQMVKDANRMTVATRDFEIASHNLYQNMIDLDINEPISGSTSKAQDPFNTAEYTTVLQHYEKNRFVMIQQLERVFETPLHKLSDDFMKSLLDKQKKLNNTVKEYDQLHRKLHFKVNDSNLKDLIIQKEETFQTQCSLYFSKTKEALETAQFDIKEQLGSYMFSFVNFSSYSNEYINQIIPALHQLTEEQHTSKQSACQLPAPLERNFSFIRDDAMKKGLEKEGYINVSEKQEKTSGKWKLRWIVIRDGQFLCFKRWKSTKPKLRFDMRFISIKTSFLHEESLHMITIISPTITLALKADDFSEFLSWKDVIEDAMKHCFYMTSNSSIMTHRSNSQLKKFPYEEFQQHILRRLTVSSPANRFCADCSSPNPDWVSINLGILICYDCSGIHRSMGVQISKVRSILLDRWSEAQINIIEIVGNGNSNSVWEATLDLARDEKPSPTAQRVARQKYILEKYVEKKFISACSLSQEDKDNRLCNAVALDDLLDASVSIIFGANINTIDNGETLLHVTTRNRNLFLTEFLLQNDCQPNLLDMNECTPLDLARMNEDNECIELLVSRGAEANLRMSGAQHYTATKIHRTRSFNSSADPQRDLTELQVIQPLSRANSVNEDLEL